MKTSHKPFSQACANNSKPILNVIKPLLVDSGSVLEIGSGTGQHAVYFGEAMPHLQWQTSDLEHNIPGIVQWLQDSKLHNVLPPITLDVTQSSSVTKKYDAVYMANTLHIMSWPVVECCFAQLGKLIEAGGLVIIYGPFNYKGSYTSDSNARFDQYLKDANLEQGIRDFEKVNHLAMANGFEHVEDKAMPANNRLLVWRFKG